MRQNTAACHKQLAVAAVASTEPRNEEPAMELDEIDGLFEAPQAMAEPPAPAPSPPSPRSLAVQSDSRWVRQATRAVVGASVTATTPQCPSKAPTNVAHLASTNLLVLLVEEDGTFTAWSCAFFANVRLSHSLKNLFVMRHKHAEYLLDVGSQYLRRWDDTPAQRREFSLPF